MAIMKIESRYLSALFVVLFALYSISPLSFAVSDNGIDRNMASASSAASLAGSFRIFFWELICSQFISRGDCVSTAPADRILISKSKAVIAGNSLSQMTFLGDLPVRDCIFQPASYHITQVSFGRDEEKPLRGIIILCSGLSPPPV